MKTLLWVLVMLAITGFLIYLTVIMLRDDRKVQRKMEHPEPKDPQG